MLCEGTIGKAGAVILALWVCWPLTAGAIILHEEGGVPSRPTDEVLGRWSTNASFVVIAPNWALTTRHQVTSPAQVVIGGAAYDCTYSSAWAGGPTGLADFRLVRLSTPFGEPAELPTFTPVYSGGAEVGMECILGGFGKGAGAELVSGSTVYGYRWNGGSNTVRRWGSNRIDGSSFANTASYDSFIIRADFDGPADGGATDNEASIAEWDSGGGWFVRVNGAWRVAGLSRAVETHSPAAAWFRDPDAPDDLDPDYLDAVRVGSYANWINDIVGELSIAGDVNLDLQVNVEDINVVLGHWLENDAGWPDGDLSGDGRVDQTDVNIVLTNWLRTAGATPAPEPTTLALLVASAAAMVGSSVRRRAARPAD